jgi:hypothetical protein
MEVRVAFVDSVSLVANAELERVRDELASFCLVIAWNTDLQVHLDYSSPTHSDYTTH